MSEKRRDRTQNKLETWGKGKRSQGKKEKCLDIVQEDTCGCWAESKPDKKVSCYKGNKVFMLLICLTLTFSPFVKAHSS